MESTSKCAVENDFFKLCCCCLQNGCSRDVLSVYSYSGQKEVYEDMLKDTFNIQIYRDKDTSPCAPRVICDQCVSRVRDATVFRQMVLANQEVLRERSESVKHVEDDNRYLVLGTSDIKVETLPVVEEYDDAFDDDEILANLKLEVTRPGTARKTTQEPRPKSKRSKTNGSEEIPQMDVQKDWGKILERRGTGPILRENSLKLLSNSTVCVFQWNKSRYRCFCCKEPFSDLTSLREHTSKHTIQQIERKIISEQNRLVKVEISLLKCKICLETVQSLPHLQSHLSERHSVQFVSKEDLLVPFKISNDLKCQLCDEKFTVFRHLNIHMNRHYQKHVCHICGSGFSNSVFLNLHNSRSHRPFTCKICKIDLNTRRDKRKHDSECHGVKYERKHRFPCPYCEERFFQENLRVQHLVDRHGVPKPEFKCTMCGKVFITKSLCNNHVKTVHMKEKKQQCEICHKLFYNKSDVLRHSVTHTGEKQYACAACDSSFATRDSLKRHLRRTHAR